MFITTCDVLVLLTVHFLQQGLFNSILSHLKDCWKTKCVTYPGECCLKHQQCSNSKTQ